MTTATVKPAKQDKTTLVLLLVAALVAVGGIGFAIGHLTAPTTTAQNPGGNGSGRNNGGFQRPSLVPGQTLNPNQFGGNGNGRGVTGFGNTGITGTVDSVNGNTMTVKLANGSTITVDLTSSTTYHNETTGSSSDVQAGKTVIVQIDTAALGSGQANPIGPGGPGAPNASPAASGAARTITAKDVLITTP